MEDGLRREEAVGAGEGQLQALGEGWSACGGGGAGVAACGLTEPLGFAVEDRGGVGFAEEEGGEEDQQGVEDGEGPEEPAPADALRYDAADDGPDGGAQQRDEGGQREGGAALVGLPAVAQDGEGDLESRASG